MTDSALKQLYWQSHDNVTRVKNSQLNQLRKLKGFVQQNALKTYWFDERKNFGDLITPLIIKANGFTAVNGQPDEATLISTGSVLQGLSENFSGTIIGSGLIREQKKTFPRATILSVRGHYTRQCLGLDNTTSLGDPGLLASDYVHETTKKFKVGLVPHYVDAQLPAIHQLQSNYPNELTVIDVAQSPMAVMSQISACEYILSSSLHGLVLADSYHIPCAWVELSDKVIGQGFKFRDYRSCFNEEIQAHHLSGDEDIQGLINLTSSRDHQQTENLKENIRQVFRQYFHPSE